MGVAATLSELSEWTLLFCMFKGGNLRFGLMAQILKFIIKVKQQLEKYRKRTVKISADITKLPFKAA